MILHRARWTLPWLCLAWGSPAHAADITVHEAWIDPGPPGIQAPALYLDIENTSDSLRTVTLHAMVAERVEIYRARYSADEAMLERVPKLELPPHTRLHFQKADMLAILYGMSHALKRNEKVKLQLNMDDGRHLTVLATIRASAPAAQP